MNYYVKIHKGSYSNKRLKLEFTKYEITLEELKKSIIKRYGNLIKPSKTSMELKNCIYKSKNVEELVEYFNIMHRYDKHEYSIAIQKFG